MNDATLVLAQELIRQPSVTPDDAGCLDRIAERLRPLGFEIEWLTFGGADDPDAHGPERIRNLWARRGQSSPLLCFLGHVDVVPTGPEAQWRHPPFSATVEDGRLYGRGAADMKGSVAAFVTALERVLADGDALNGSLAVLLTADEEGPARDGTRRVVQTLQARGETIDYCIVGEPSSERVLGDTLRVGRRGSLTGHVQVHGIQGHVAYPDQARNPIHDALPALDALASRRWDEGDEAFPPTSFQLSNVHAGTGADNVIPGSLEATFNFRFAPCQTAESLKDAVRSVLDAHALTYDVSWRLSGEPFVTRDGALVDAMETAIEAETGQRPVRSTGGGTSDGRFVAPTGAETVEFGPLNATIHQIDEHVEVEDLSTLSRCYEGVVQRLLRG